MSEPYKLSPKAKKKREATIIAKYGSIDAFRKIQAEGGRKGGKTKTKKGFASMDAGTLSELSRKGGKISRRGKAKKH